jgi:hypothetical protein
VRVLALAAAAALLAPPAFHPRTSLIVPERIAGVGIGMTRQAVVAQWGKPVRTQRPPTASVYLDWSTASDPWFAQVELRHGKVERVVVLLRTTALHTPFGDHYGTTASSFRRHWPRATRHLGCCSEGFVYAVPGRRGYLLAFHFFRSRLDRVELMSARQLRCYEVECA